MGYISKVGGVNGAVVLKRRNDSVFTSQILG